MMKKNNQKKNTAGRIDTYTKLAVTAILINALAWVWCSYVLAYLGRYEIAESLSGKAIDTILGTFITYAAKSLFENVNKNGFNMLPTRKSGTSKTNIYRDI